jgi:hypothetical protein
MGTSKYGQPPFSPSDVQKTPTSIPDFGSGGRSVVPNQGYPAMGPILYALLQRIGTPVASTAGLTATLQNDRADGMITVTLDTYTIWLWQDQSSASPSSTVIEPTDAASRPSPNAGLGRWVAYDGTLV